MTASASLVFTDLDGTLLNHHDYSYETALPMIARLKNDHIPIIIVTSKTRSEVAQLRKALGIDDPFIVENGAGIFIPESSPLPPEGESYPGYRCIRLGKTREEVLKFYAEVKTPYGLKGFSDMSVSEVSRRTGLDETDAALAKARDFTEPFIAKDDAVLADLVREAAVSGLEIVKGGRFYHLITRGQDKGHALRRLASLYEHAWGIRPKSIALGDSANDFSMLEASDIPILIPRPDGTFAPLSLPHLVKAPYPGSRGWHDALKEVLYER